MGNRTPVAAGQARIECVGVSAPDRRRVDVAVDVTPCIEPLSVELVIVDDSGVELCSAVVIESHEWALDKMLHLRCDAGLGEHTLHVGLFREEALVDHVVRRFCFPEPDATGGE